MKLPLYLLCICFCISCGSDGRKSVITEKDRIDPGQKYHDSLSSLKFDTSTIDGKVKYIINQKNLELYLKSHVLKDSLFDLNYDGNNDLVLWFYIYNKAGTATIRTNTYFYDPMLKCFILNPYLNLSGPAFYINKKKITSYYFGNDGGEGGQLEWINDKWQTTIIFHVLNNNPENDIWEIEYPLNGKTKNIMAPYGKVPPEIMETD